MFINSEIINSIKSNNISYYVKNHVSSTNDYLNYEYIRDQAPIVILSNNQRHPRGRRGKKWVNFQGCSLGFSLCLKFNASLNKYLTLSHLVGISIIESCSILGNKSLKIKWPNDILFNDKKIGGILVETEINKENIKTIIGIGINLNINKEESWWGDLSQFALESKRNELINLILTEFLNIFDNSYDDWVDDWKKSCMHINKEIEIFDGEHLQKKAIFKDIDAQGNAVIESNEGEEVIATGQISIKGVY